MPKVISRDRSIEASYEVSGHDDDGKPTFVLRSAYQRREILERTEYDDGTVEIKVVGHWRDGEKARKECEAFNVRSYKELNA